MTCSLDYTTLRQRMVTDQLLTRGIHDPRVLAAMSNVPREEFVPRRLRRQAYWDTPLPVGKGQTISQPYTVAFMCEHLALNGEEKVLEIGTGSGYGAAVLAELAREVHTVERISSLAERARTRLAKLSYDNVHVHVANGALGLPEHAPFDAIVVTAAAVRPPAAYQRQLAEGGRLLIPVGAEWGPHVMSLYTREGDEVRSVELGEFQFVPLV